ncbi:hypothetical protein [Streptomyces sp. NBC_01017]|uniref:hypothetical protein n=1 Tax=Streptomyces sp. NBC_01017 TaxID=2903721 RepID=UPI00386D8683
MRAAEALAVDLVRRDFTASRPGIRLVGDMTELVTAEGKAYLASCIDLAMREVIGWAMADHHRAERPVTALRMAAGRGQLARRRLEDPGKRDYYLGRGPTDTPVEEIVLVPGARRRVEEAIKLAKSACGMADYEVRSFHGWYRHVTLAQLAAAFLAGCDAATARENGPPARTRYGRPPPAAPVAERGGPA